MCDDESLSEIPFEQIPQNLTFLKISGTKISHIKEKAFQYKSVETLSMADNEIVSLNRFYLVEFSIQTHNIFFSLAFEGLFSTRYLNLSNNIIAYETSNHHSFFGVFKHLEELEQLDVSNNNISLELVDQVMYDEDPILPCLRYLNFENNPLKQIERHFFFGLRYSKL